jgi:hypothetical protein
MLHPLAGIRRQAPPWIRKSAEYVIASIVSREKPEKLRRERVEARGSGDLSQMSLFHRSTGEPNECFARWQAWAATARKGSDRAGAPSH